MSEHQHTKNTEGTRPPKPSEGHDDQDNQDDSEDEEDYKERKDKGGSKRDALDSKYRELKSKYKRQTEVSKKFAEETKRKQEANLEFQRFQLRDAVLVVRKMREGNTDPLDEKFVRSQASNIIPDHLLHGVRGFLNFLLFFILIGKYRYSLKKKQFEYLSKSEKWKTDRGAIKLKKVVFTPLYPKCKEAYDKKMSELDKECFGGEKHSLSRFTDFRDRMREILEVVMNIGNGIEGDRETAFLVDLLNELIPLLGHGS